MLLSDNLFGAIKSHALSEAESGEWQSVADILNSTTDPVGITELRTTRWLMTEFDDIVDPNTGMTSADVILNALQKSSHPRVRAAYEAMAGNGIDLSNPQVQGMISVLANASGWPASMLSKIQAASFDSRSKASLAGFPDVTADQCRFHYGAGVSRDAGTISYDQRHILLCLNTGPDNSSLTLRVTPATVLDGVEVRGNPVNIGGAASVLKGDDSKFFTDLQSLIDGFIDGRE